MNDSNKRLVCWLGGAVSGLLLAAGNASAGFLGNSISAQPLFPDTSTACCGAALTALVGGGVEFPAGSFSSYSLSLAIDVSDFVIDYSLSGAASYTPGAFNGFHFFDVFATIDPIVGVTIDPATSLAGFDMSRVSFDADNIYINMESLTDDDGHLIRLNVRFDGAAAPEPGSLALLSLGFGLLGLARRRVLS